MIKKNKIQKIIIGILVTVLFLNTSSPYVMANIEMGAPILDGLIGEAEWSGADVNEVFFIDADNSDGNIDGQNRLLIGEDDENLYIALDLNSDQTVDPSSEWVGIWLNTNNRSFSDIEKWNQYLNDGVESLMINVSNEEIWNPWNSEGSDMDSVFLDEEDLVIPTISSSYTGNYTNLLDPRSPEYTINSTEYAGDETTRLDLVFDLSNYYGALMDEYSNHIDRIEVIVRSNLNESISTHRLVVWKPDGTLDVNDPNQYFDLSTAGESWSSSDDLFNVGNLTADNIFKISLLANSSLGQFQAQYSYVYLNIEHDSLNDIDYVVERPFSTIKNAEIAVGFGPSSLNSTNHRQFEFKIPKSELEHYDSNEKLGIIVGGYGTLSFMDTDYWVYGENNDSIYEEDSDEYLYFDMNGVESGDAISINNPEDLNYDIGQTGQNITWVITDITVSTPGYTIYQNGTVNAIGSWTSGTPIVLDLDPFVVGIYNLTIIATDGYGGTVEDEVIVTVKSNATTDPTTDPTNTRIDPFADDPLRNVPGYPVLVFSSVIFVSIANLLWHKKRRI
ncbi:MAG: hypothetical protein ACTSVZ_10445 [Promethearchaeota archaeon]